MFNVTYSKTNGNLRLGSKEISWTATDQSRNVTIPYETIKTQLVNVVSSKSSKVLLKVTQWGTGEQGEVNYNFQFVGADPVADREKVKEVLAVHISAQRANPSAAGPCGAQAANNTITYHDIPLRQALLAKDKELSKLHRELVISGTISEADFWSSRQHLLANQNWESSQKKGTSSASLADIKPAAEGTDLKYTLTPEIIHSIFIQYPSVYAAYQKNVPEKLTEKEFWTKYFSSKFFHRSRLPGQVPDDDDFFKDYINEDEDDYNPTPKKLKYDASNKLLDLSTTAEDHLETGNSPDITMRAGTVRSALPLIRRLNRHSTVVLKPARNFKPASAGALYNDETKLDDLLPPQASPQVILEISHDLKKSDLASSFTKDIASEKLDDFKASIASWTLELPKTLIEKEGGAAINKALDLASDKQKRKGPSCKESGSNTVADDVLSLHAMASELLRHFWSASRKNDPSSVAKAQRILESLKAFQERIDAASVASLEYTWILDNLNNCIQQACQYSK
ncbi:RNA polymerase II transcription factor B subunit 1 [Chytridiales sp. JEL 0842]|nr:RNA polymerase II transcription factor B subunit 1 [Chytridiales sp. JEL 0842]